MPSGTLLAKGKSMPTFKALKDNFLGTNAAVDFTLK